MPHLATTPLCAALLLLCAGGFGCRPALTTTDQAEDWTLADRDAPSSIEAAEWPGWRGLNAAGIGTGSPPVEFGPAQNLRWQTELPGRGHSSPVVWNDRIFVTAAIGPDEPPALAVLCLNRHDGSLRWQAAADRARGGMHDKNSYASPTVATDGRRVFAFFGSAGLFCFDIDGQPLWHAKFPSLDHRWGFGGSPVLFGDMVIVVADGESESAIVAFDQTSGQQRWRTERPSQGSWSTPVFVSVDVDGQPRVEMVVNGTTREPSGEGLVIAYDPLIGDERWRVRGTETFVTPTTLVCNGLVYSLSGRNGPIIAIRPGGQGDVTDSHVVWKLSRGGPYIPSAVAYRNRLFVLGDAGRLACYNAGNGQEMWNARLRGNFTSSLVAADGRLYATNEAGIVYVVAAGDEYSLLARNDMGARCYATPAIVDGELLIRTDEAMLCFADAAADAPAARPASSSSPTTAEQPAQPAAAEARPATASWTLFRGDSAATGIASDALPDELERLWTFSVERGGFESAVAIVDGMVYAGGSDGKVYKLALANGAKQWEFDTKSVVTAAAAVRNGLVYIGDADGVFHCLDAADGQQRWRYETEGEINAGANFFDGRVLVGSQDANLYCLGADDGKLVWKYESADQIRSFPTIAGDRALVAGCDGRLHAIRLSDGQSVGETDLKSPTGATAAVMGDVAFVGTEGNEFLAVDWKKGEVVWRYEAPQRPGAYRSSAAITPDEVIVGSRDKIVRALDPKTGDERWQFVTKSPVDSSPVVVGRRVFVGSGDGRLYALDVASGEERWQFDAGGRISGSPAVAAGRLVIGNDRGDLFCFGLKVAASQ
jgi:outer membrane protein assembly factor BamB